MKLNGLSISIILLAIVLMLINLIIPNFDWYFRSYVIYGIVYMFFCGIFLLILSNITAEESKANGAYITLLIISSIIIFFVARIVMAWTIKDTIIKEIDGTNYCGEIHLTLRMRKDVYYYKDYNLLAYHKTKECIEEFFDNEKDVIPLTRTYHKEKITDEITNYYDKKGEITKVMARDENDKPVEIQQ